MPQEHVESARTECCGLLFNPEDYPLGEIAHSENGWLHLQQYPGDMRPCPTREEDHA